MTVELITPTAYARHRGCDEKAVRKAIKANRISLIDGKIDPVVADIQWAQNTRARVKAPPPAQATLAPSTAAEAPTAPNPPVGGTEPGYQDHRARRELADAEMAEVQAARAAKRAIDRERAERGAFEAFRELRDAIMSATKSQARRVIGLTEVREIELALEDEAREAFSGWEARMRDRLRQAEDA